jgi:hypothetical protein
VLGAYSVVTGQLTTIANNSYIRSVTICGMLQKLAKEYVGREIVIVIVLDNARYLRYLNLIERLCKFV